ncbi:MAG: alpha/beta fold hydrolase [Solirubrobacterales bacterium]|nr:alpha/beta fold hydrolase [Solirubrobacterales bacterium]
MAALADIELRDGYADLSGARIHYVEAGDGPMVVLVHGFPEFWYSWRHQIPALARAGFRVVAPDMRGYNLSSKPPNVSAYEPRRLAGDLSELIAERGASRACVAGHDWGGAVAWVAAMAHPEVVERLAILNVPHPRRMLKTLSRPGKQLARSWYMFFFQLPWLPEEAVRVGEWWFFRHGFEHDARPGAFTPADIERYREAWSQPGAATATINYYRASMRRRPGRHTGADAELRPVQAPTLVIWGERDRHLGAELAEPDRADVPNLERVVRLPDASHWVQHDEPDRVSALLIDFFKR